MNKHEKAFFDEWTNRTVIEILPQYRLVVHELNLEPSKPGILKRIRETGFKDWRFDFCLPSQKVLIELQGVGYGHFSIKGYKDDLFKARVAAKFGWLLFPFMSNDVLKRPDIAVDFVLDSIG